MNAHDASAPTPGTPTPGTPTAPTAPTAGRGPSPVPVSSHPSAPGLHLQLQLSADLSAARQARQLLRRCCEQLQLVEQVRQVVLLLGSELVTNAIVHGGAPVHLSISVPHAGSTTEDPDQAPGTGHESTGQDLGTGVHSTGLRLSVSDSSLELPVVRAEDPAALGGRGMHLVRELSTAWGGARAPRRQEHLVRHRHRALRAHDRALPARRG
ncbi:ATP-binding protein [Kineococcus sp. SYSU DK005]|uniref:ATP-binding protein n=1 Tax=Kineococcus sp. SYSU DK005 TaxID=3383126 RepID=UPI003D7E7507